MENYFFREDSVVDQQSSQETCISSGTSLDSIEESLIVVENCFNEQYY